MNIAFNITSEEVIENVMLIWNAPAPGRAIEIGHFFAWNHELDESERIIFTDFIVNSEEKINDHNQSLIVHAYFRMWKTKKEKIGWGILLFWLNVSELLNIKT